MTTWYVDPETGGGSPAGSGTLLDPWNGIGNIVWGSVASGGDTLQFSGTYTAARLTLSKSGSTDNNIILGGLFDGTLLTQNTAIFSNSNVNWTVQDAAIEAYGGADLVGQTYGIRFGNNAGSGSIIKNCSIDGTDAGGDTTRRAIQFVAKETDVNDVTVDGCSFTDNDRDIVFQMASTGQPGEFNDIKITNNTSKGAIEFSISVVYENSTGSDVTAGRRHYRTKIIGNRIDGNIKQTISERGGVNCLIRGNYITNSGVGNAFTNAINPGADIDSVFEDNTIIGVFGTGTGDGNGIIVDWYVTDTNASVRTTVRRNYIEDAKKDVRTGSISVFKGIDSDIYSNVAFDGAAGLKQSSTVSTGNTWSNNSVGLCSYAGFLGRINTPVSTLRNCILHATGLHSVEVETGSALPNLSYNCYFGFTAGQPISDGGTLVAPDSTSIVADPKFRDLANGDLRLQGDSPCINAGLRWWAGLPGVQGQDGLRYYNNPSMGAFEVRQRSGYTRRAGVLKATTLPAGVDIVKARKA